MVCKLLEILATIGGQLLDRQQKLQLLRVVLCSFHVDALLAHQLNEIHTYIAPALWQVVKDYTMLLSMSDCINTIVCEVSVNYNCLCREISYPTQSLCNATVFSRY